MIIKLFLIGSALLGVLWLVRGQTSAGRLALTRMGGLLLASGWIVAVLAPSTVSRLATLVGVGRGTDLVLYVTVVAFMVNTVLQRSRMQQLESRIVRLTRAQALLEARTEDERTSTPHVG